MKAYAITDQANKTHRRVDGEVQNLYRVFVWFRFLSLSSNVPEQRCDINIEVVGDGVELWYRAMVQSNHCSCPFQIQHIR